MAFLDHRGVDAGEFGGFRGGLFGFALFRFVVGGFLLRAHGGEFRGLGFFLSFQLGSLLFIGTDTIPANPTRAQQLLDEAVASDDPLAIIQVALCYLNGEGVAVNRPRANALLQRAANLGSSEAIELQKTFFPD